MQTLEERLEHARNLSWARWGKRLTVYLPGMFSYHGLSGLYPALSITGRHCSLQCDHCCGKTLEGMPSAEDPETLVRQCLGLAERGNHGILLSGGCDPQGRLPWHGFMDAISDIKRKTRLHVSIHSGLMDGETARGLKEAGVDQALLDVIGDDETYQSIYHVPFGISRIIASLEALEKAGLPVVPHIVCGLHQGKIQGEYKALEIVSGFSPRLLVIVSLMRIRGTPSFHYARPLAAEIARLIATARERLPETEISLGCARERGYAELEVLAIEAGINRLALPSEEALIKAREYGLDLRYQRTCCSVTEDFSHETWEGDRIG